MNKKALTNCTVFNGRELLNKGTVVLDGSIIEAVIEGDTDLPTDLQILDLEGRLLAPGFVDLQVNGGADVLFNNSPDVETIRKIGIAHRRFGTTGFLPTLMTTDFQTMQTALRAVEDAIHEDVPGVLGIHLEGPFLQPEYSGIHDPVQFCQIDDRFLDLITSSSAGVVLITVAPEIAGTEWIRKLRSAGVIVFGGHSAASYDETAAAVSAGMSGFTHLYNAMPVMRSRDPGIAAAAITCDGCWLDIIADGHHVHPSMISLAVRARGPDRTILVTDAMPCVGGIEDSFVLNGETITVRDGLCISDSGVLAGSSLDMISAVINTTRFTGLDITRVLPMVSGNPASAINLATELGQIAPGFRASMVELDPSLRIYRTWIEGKASE